MDETVAVKESVYGQRGPAEQRVQNAMMFEGFTACNESECSMTDSIQQVRRVNINNLPIIKKWQEGGSNKLSPSIKRDLFLKKNIKIFNIGFKRKAFISCDA